MIALYLVDGKRLKRWSVRGSVSLAIEIGRRIIEAGGGELDPVDSILELTKGYRLFEGKVTDVQGVVSVKPVMHRRWTPVAGQMLMAMQTSRAGFLPMRSDSHAMTTMPMNRFTRLMLLQYQP